MLPRMVGFFDAVDADAGRGRGRLRSAHGDVAAVAEGGEESMKRIRRFLLRSVVVVLSLVVGFASAVLAVRMVPPLELESGGAEGTPLQIAAFVAAFVFGTAVSLIFGMQWLERHFRR